MTESANLKAKVIKGSLSYFIRQVLVTLIQVLSNIILLKWLAPQDFGIFTTLTIIIGLAQIFSEGGLSVYLIQRLEEVDDKSLSEIASIQLFAYGILHFIVIIVYFIFCYLGLTTNLILFVSVVLLILPLNIFKSNSFVKLERNLRFDKIAIIEIIESISFSLASIFLVFYNFGIWGLVIATLLKAIIGLFVSLKFSTWKFKFKLPIFNSNLIKGLKFGLNFHMPNLVTSLRLAINPIIIGSMIGLGAVGLADRAIYFAGLPLFFLGAVQQKVLFPYFSRIQLDVNSVRSNFEISYYLSAIIDKIFYIPMVLFGESIINKFAPQWNNIFPLFYVAIIGNIVFGALSFSSYPVLNGLGKSQLITKLSLFSMIFSWVLIWPLIHHFGLMGYIYLGLILWFAGSVPTIIIVLNHIPKFSFFRQLLFPLTSFYLTYLISKLIFIPGTVTNIIYMAIISIIAIIFYFSFLLILDGKFLIPLFNKVFRILFNKN